MTSIRNRYLSFREAYDAYADRVPKPVTEASVRRWMNQGRVPAIKRGSHWIVEPKELVRYHINNIGTGEGKTKGKLRRKRIKAVAPYQLDASEWPPHVEEFLKGRKVVRPRQILDLVGVPKEKLGPEVKAQINKVKELLTSLGWAQMPPPHSYDWAPLEKVKKARKKTRSKELTDKEVEKLQRKLLRRLKSGGMYSLPEIAKELEVSYSQGKRIVLPLYDEGKLAAIGRGHATMYYRS